MSATDKVSLGSPLPRVRSVQSAGGLSVTVKWASGSRSGRVETIDLSPQILAFRMYRPLRDNAPLFRKVAVVAKGAAIGWDDGAIDISASVLERLAESVMTNADFVAFLKRNKLSLDAAAGLLGISRRLVAYYAKDRPIPRYIALACERLEMRAA